MGNAGSGYGDVGGAGAEAGAEGGAVLAPGTEGRKTRGEQAAAAKDSLIDMDLEVTGQLHSASRGVLHGRWAGKHHVPVAVKIDRHEITLVDAEPALGKAADVLVKWAFVHLTDIVWDHASSRVRLTHADSAPAGAGGAAFSAADPFAAAPGAAAAPPRSPDQIVLVLPNTLSTEKALNERYLSKVLEMPNAPSISHHGVITDGTAKPLERATVDMASAVGSTHGGPSFEDMERARALHAHAPITSARRGLALEHINRGANTFKVIDSAGHERILLLDYSGIRVHNTEPIASRTYAPEHALLAVPYAEVAGWAVINLSPGNPAFAMRVHRMGAPEADAEQHSFRYSNPLRIKSTLEFFCNLLLAEMGVGAIDGSAHGREVASREKLELDDVVQGRMHRPMSYGSAEMAALASHAAAEKDGASIPPYWDKLLVTEGWLLKKGGMMSKWQKRWFCLFRTSQGHVMVYYSSRKDTPIFKKRAAGELTAERGDIFDMVTTLQVICRSHA